MNGQSGLTGREKVIVAIGAATGAGCRRCAEKLVAKLEPAGASMGEAEAAFVEGFHARDRANQQMARKAASLLGRALKEHGETSDALGKLGQLVRLAAAVAANSAPDAVTIIDNAVAAGASRAEVEAVIGIARLVRSRAQQFSDAELVPWLPKEESEGPARAGGECCGGPALPG